MNTASCGADVFTVDVPAIGAEQHAPLLVLHGFPTSSFDYAAVLDGLRAGCRVCCSTCSATDCPPSLTAATRWPCRPTSP